VTGVLLYLLGVVVFLLGVGLSIGLHEIGHLVPAKRFGARVPKYMIGFGPTIWSTKKGETEYGIKLLPLGGFISISGMFPPKPVRGKASRLEWLRDWVESARKQQNQVDGEFDQSRAFYNLAIWKRIIIMLGGPVMNLVLGVVILSVAFMGIGTFQTGTTVERVQACVPVNYQDANCAPTAAQSPAKAAGFLPGDKVTAFNGQPVTVWQPIFDYLAKHPSQPVSFTVERAGKPVNLTVTPAVVERPVIDDLTGNAVTNPDGSVKLQNRGVLGLALNSVRAPNDAWFTARYIGMNLGETFRAVASLPAQVGQVVMSTFGGQQRSSTGLVSVVGIGNIAGSVGESNQLDPLGKLAIWLMMLGSLNFALFVFNLFPLLPLDGGHVFSAIIEWFKRTAFKLAGKADPGPLDTARAVPFTMAMWVVLMGMSLLVILADIIKPISPGWLG